MSSKLNKMKTGVTKRIDPNNTNLTAHRDYDFERRSTDMRRLSHALGHFDHAVTQGMIAMKEIASAFEAVGQAFTELTLGTVNTHTHDSEHPEPAPFPMENEDLSVYNNDPNYGSTGGAAEQRRSGGGGADTSGVFAGDADGAMSVASTRLTDETNGQVRRLAQMFAEETRRINEGQPFQSYNAGMHRDVVTRLRPVNEHLKSVEIYRQKRSEALEKYNRYKSDVEKVEKQYAKKGKPFCDSKSHKKYSEKRDEAWKEYIKRRDKFNETFSLLMEVNDHAAAQIIHRYLALNDEYLRQLVASIGRILPAMAEAYPLNQEYTTTQNSMILEAVANARTPFAKHYREAELEEPKEQPVAEEEGGDNEDGSESTTVSSVNTNSLSKGAVSNKENNSVARKAPGSSSSGLEEPTGDEEKDHHTRQVARGPLMGDGNAPAPPHEDSDGDVDNDADKTRAAGNTSEEPGYMLTQQTRLHTVGDAAAPAEGAVHLPGSVQKE